MGLVTLSLARFQLSPSPETVLLGCVNGVILFLYNLGMIQASRTGPYAFHSIVMLFGSIVVCLVFSAAVSLVYLIATQGKRPPQAFRMGTAAWGFAVGSGLCAAFAVYLLMVLLAYIPSYILYTVNNGGILILSAILCRIVLKERMTKMTIAGIALSVLGIVLLSI